jgi:hypothetical protein
MRVAAGETNRPNILRAVGSALPAAAHAPTLDDSQEAGVFLKVKVEPAFAAAEIASASVAAAAVDLAAILPKLDAAALNAPTPDAMSGTNDPTVWATPPGSKYC